MNGKVAPIGDDLIAQLKKDYDPALVDALLTRSADIDYTEAYTAALSALMERSPFDKLALERRTHEAALIKEEVQMFKEMRKLMQSINARYAALTGLPPVGADGED